MSIKIAIKRKVMNVYMANVLKKEKVFKGEECSLKYLFLGNENSDKLLVIFSGFPAVGKPPVYNYVLKFKDIKCNKLYILDDFGYDNRGSYYLGEKKNFFVDRAVTELIKEISYKHNIKQNDIITTGSSKGGYASIYYAFKNNYGAAIAGEPQVLLGNYLANPEHQVVFNYIAGDVNPENIDYLNKLLFKVINNTEHRPRLYLFCTKDRYHYREHLKYLLEELQIKNIEYEADLGDYNGHANLGKYFPPFVFKSIDKETNG